MYTVRHRRHTRSLRVVWALEEIGADYELHAPASQDATARPWSARPGGCRAQAAATPAAVFADADHAMTETEAIVDYVLARAGSPLRPLPQDPRFRDYLAWSHAGEATLTAPLAIIARHAGPRLPGFDAGPRAGDADAARAGRQWAQGAAALAGQLNGRDFVAGARFTGADIMVGYALHLAGLLGVLNAAPARVHAYWRRLCERPAYGRAAAA